MRDSGVYLAFLHLGNNTGITNIPKTLAEKVCQTNSLMQSFVRKVELEVRIVSIKSRERR